MITAWYVRVCPALRIPLTGSHLGAQTSLGSSFTMISPDICDDENKVYEHDQYVETGEERTPPKKLYQAFKSNNEYLWKDKK